MKYKTEHRIAFTQKEFIVEVKAASLVGAWKFWQLLEPQRNFTKEQQENANGLLRAMLAMLVDKDGWLPRSEQEYEVAQDLSGIRAEAEGVK